jgi:hypothetical protein
LDNIPKHISFDALTNKYDFDLSNEKNVIGKGSFGEVHRLIKKDDNTVFAGKYMAVAQISDFQKLLNEKVLHKKLAVIPCVMPLVDYYVWIETSAQSKKKSYHLMLVMIMA